MPINIHDPQDSDIIYAFSNWMHKWEKKYPSIDEKHARLDHFKNNILNQPFIPASAPLWNLLNDYADQPITENFHALRLDYYLHYEIIDDDGVLVMHPYTRQKCQRHWDKQKNEDVGMAFRNWKQMWDKEYPSTEEEKARFQDFKHNVLHQAFMPASEPLCYLLSPMADEPRTENFDVLRLDHCKIDDGLDDDLPSGHYIICPVDKEDGTTDIRYLTIEEYWEQRKDDTKEEDQDDATVKHQSTVLPVKRTSSDDKDDTVKRQNIGCGGQEPGCCSDCGK